MAASSSPPRDPAGEPFAEEGQRLGSVHESTPRLREKVKRRNSQNHHFPMKNLHFWKTTRRPQVASCLMWPQPGVVSFTTESDATDSDFPSGDPHAGPLGSADSRGLRPHASTLQRARAPQLPRRDDKRRSGRTVNVDTVCDLTRDVPESLHSFQSSNSLWFADFIQKFELVVVCGSACTPASSCNSKEAPRRRLRS